MRILYNNYVMTAEISASTEIPTATFEVGLTDRRLSRVGKTMTNIDQYVDFDLGEEKTIKYCVILGDNFTDDADIFLHGNTSSDFASPGYTETIEKKNGVWMLELSEEYRYWRLEFDDPTNIVNYLPIGLVYLGGYLDCPGMDVTMQLPRQVTDIIAKSQTGQIYTDIKLYIRSLSVTFPLVTQEEKNLLDEVFSSVRIGIPLIVVPWENDIEVEAPLYCHIVDGLNWSRTPDNGLLWTLSMKFEEVF
jgi:hypothetical protein